ncbi:MAG: HlyD family type I secretion periplasmic adaptor subunit [Methylobacteriaceae bacterium]|nr:HlyD family type I secretion periplasmic adaptor subunit [Methylobacteriaceae bacterium]
MVEPVPIRPEPRAAEPAIGPTKPKRAGTVIALPQRSRPPRLSAEERQFLPAALEVIETPASPALRWTALAICALVTVALVWSWSAHIDMVAVAPGKVVPLGQVKVVQPLETAMIRAIHVDDGDHVQAGQLLVDLDPTEARADLGALTYNLGQAALDAEVARLLLTRNPNEPFIAPPGIDARLADQNRMQAEREIERHVATLGGLEADLAQKEAALEANAAQIERVELILPIAEERFTVLKGLYERQVGARPPVLEAQQQLLERKADLKSAHGAAAQLAAEMRSLRAKADEVRAAFLADASERRTKALQKLAGLEQEITKARQKESYRRLVAPVDGTVQGVKVHTPGAVVTTADTLMTVVPNGTGIEIEALVQNADIGFVGEGQEVEVKLEAFPFTRYGLVRGRLRKLGRDAATAAPGPSVGGAPTSSAGVAPPGAADLAYPAKVALAQDWIGVDGRREPIRAGMRVSAEIRTGERRVLEYLLSPVVQALQEAGRER